MYLVEGDVSGVREQAGRGVATLARSVMCAVLVLAAWRAVNCRLLSLQWALGPGGRRPISISARAHGPRTGLPPLGAPGLLWAHVHIDGRWDGRSHATNAAVECGYDLAKMLHNNINNCQFDDFLNIQTKEVVFTIMILAFLVCWKQSWKRPLHIIKKNKVRCDFYFMLKPPLLKGFGT